MYEFWALYSVFNLHSRQLSGLFDGLSFDGDNLKSSGDCSIRVFYQQVHVLLEYFVTVVYDIIKWASFIRIKSLFCDSAGTEVLG